jgi:glycosyltransferase involved in cell wall biosynthesis
MNNVGISIIIPTFNRRELLCHALDSIRKQEFRPIEIIVVDDGSIDGTKESVTAWVRNVGKNETLNLKYLQQTNRGPGAARNAGLREASGAFVLFLDSDDMLADDGLSKLYKHVMEDSAVVGGAIEFVEQDSKLNRLFLPIQEGCRAALDDYIRGSLSINCGCWLTSTKLAKSVAPFPEDIFIAEDSIYFLGLIQASSKVIRVMEPVLILRAHTSGRLTDNTGTLKAKKAEARYMTACAQAIFKDSTVIAEDTQNQIASKILRLAMQFWTYERQYSEQLITIAHKINANVSPEYKNIFAKILWRLSGVPVCGTAYSIGRNIVELKFCLVSIFKR